MLVPRGKRVQMVHGASKQFRWFTSLLHLATGDDNFQVQGIVVAQFHVEVRVLNRRSKKGK